MRSRIAIRNSGRVPKLRLRKPAITQVATCETVFSTLALSFGRRILPGSTAAE